MCTCLGPSRYFGVTCRFRQMQREVTGSRPGDKVHQCCVFAEAVNCCPQTAAEARSGCQSGPPTRDFEPGLRKTKTRVLPATLLVKAKGPGTEC